MHPQLSYPDLRIRRILQPKAGCDDLRPEFIVKLGNNNLFAK
jgi:hypothetical protein